MAEERPGNLVAAASGALEGTFKGSLWGIGVGATAAATAAYVAITRSPMPLANVAVGMLQWSEIGLIAGGLVGAPIGAVRGVMNNKNPNEATQSLSLKAEGSKTVGIAQEQGKAPSILKANTLETATQGVRLATSPVEAPAEAKRPNINAIDPQIALANAARKTSV